MGSRRTSRIVRKPSRHHSKGHPIQHTANRMYVDSEQMLQCNSGPPGEPNVGSIAAMFEDLAPHRADDVSIGPNSMEQEIESHAHTSTDVPPLVPAHASQCACSQKQISLAQKRIAELEARHNTLVEHLNLQRSRLAAADATVVSLARTLLQFTMKNDQGKSMDLDPNTSIHPDEPSALNDMYTKPAFAPPKHLVGALIRQNTLPGSVDSITRLEGSEARQPNGFIPTGLPMTTTVSSKSLDPMAWVQAPTMPTRMQHNMRKL
ncbi:unnamed protein product [Echinostoma caproni]|uniref:Uncharacterized protein n=1 Tax=Echinostoma caproni TaxID=27848 RepID=A0A183A754_9TREM|nr:unnamed protein product [Echinostoma caproni]